MDISVRDLTLRIDATTGKAHHSIEASTFRESSTIYLDDLLQFIDEAKKAIEHRAGKLWATVAAYEFSTSEIRERCGDFEGQELSLVASTVRLATTDELERQRLSDAYTEALTIETKRQNLKRRRAALVQSMAVDHLSAIALVDDELSKLTEG